MMRPSGASISWSDSSADDQGSIILVIARTMDRTRAVISVSVDGSDTRGYDSEIGFGRLTESQSFRSCQLSGTNLVKRI
jgi:hypothetical protein